MSVGNGEIGPITSVSSGGAGVSSVNDDGAGNFNISPTTGDVLIALSSSVSIDESLAINEQGDVSGGTVFQLFDANNDAFLAAYAGAGYSSDYVSIVNLGTFGHSTSTPTLTSGTGYQASTVTDVDLVINFTPAAEVNGTAVIAISPDDSTYTTLTTMTVVEATAVPNAIPFCLHLPAGWYVKVTMTTATLGTVVQY